MMDEVHLMSDVKEAACFVSSSFTTDLERTWKGNKKRGASTTTNDNQDVDESIVVDYVLPDYNTRPPKPGFMRPHAKSSAAAGSKKTAKVEDSEASMTLANERFTVPELLFSPSDIGMKEAGLPELVMQSLAAVPDALWPAMLANVVAVGGNATIPGLIERLYVELISPNSFFCSSPFGFSISSLLTPSFLAFFIQSHEKNKVLM